MVRGKLTFVTIVQLALMVFGTLLFALVGILEGAAIGFLLAVLQTIIGLYYLATLSRYSHFTARLIQSYWGGYILYFLALATNDFNLASTGTPYWLKVFFFLGSFVLANLMCFISFRMGGEKPLARKYRNQTSLHEN